MVSQLVSCSKTLSAGNYCLARVVITNNLSLGQWSQLGGRVHAYTYDGMGLKHGGCWDFLSYTLSNVS